MRTHHEYGAELGEWLYDQIARETIVDTGGWAFERARAAAERVQALDPPGERLVPVVPWLEVPVAFTAPGRYVYISRELLQCALPEDAVGFVFAHEVAHHRLGHLLPLEEGLPWLRGAGRWALALLVRFGKRLLFSPEQELAADRWAIERALAAGYDGERCLSIFRALEREALDKRDIAAVFGPEDEERCAEIELTRLEGEPRARVELRGRAGTLGRWLWERRRGYPTLRERRAAIERVLDARGARAPSRSTCASRRNG